MITGGETLKLKIAYNRSKRFGLETKNVYTRVLTSFKGINVLSVG